MEKCLRRIAGALSVPSSSIKNLRDEFDPLHGNQRIGWHQRPLRPNRQRVLDDLKDVSDAALMALVDRIIARDEEATAEAVDSLAAIPRTAHNVAERLLTGRRAEEYFLAHSHSLVGIEAERLLDRRQSACGYDFGVTRSPEVGIEVKGLKHGSGEILFTDREWNEANIRLDNYWLVVIGCTFPIFVYLFLQRGVRLVRGLEAHARPPTPGLAVLRPTHARRRSTETRRTVGCRERRPQSGRPEPSARPRTVATLTRRPLRTNCRTALRWCSIQPA